MTLFVYSCCRDVGHDFRRENLTFWLFQNYVRSDLMSNNMKLNGDNAQLKI